MKRVVWDVEARKSLNRICKYIRKRSSADQAGKVRKRILKAARSLGRFPARAAKEPLLWEDEQIRFIMVYRYKILFEIQEQHVAILELFHTSRDPARLLHLKKR